MNARSYVSFSAATRSRPRRFAYALAVLVLAATAAPRRADALIFWVTNTNQSGVGSLKKAIDDANLTALTDTIKFAIGSGQQTITPMTALPALTQPVIIDATSQPMYMGSPLIELDGSVAGGVGLRITAGNSTVKGLVINRFLRGIYLDTGSGNVVRNCWIGTDKNGTAALGNTESGIFIASGGGNIIGGTAAADRNVIAGNGANGITISGGDGNMILGNRIGTNVAGTADVGNGGYAVRAFSSNNVIGVAIPGGGNLVSGNGRGIALEEPGTNNFVQNNLIGLDVNGTAAIPNDGAGVDIFGDGNQIGNGTPEGRNVIAANTAGITVTGNDTIIRGNRVGTNAAGTAAVGAQSSGIQVYSGVNTQIGGRNPADGNLVSGNYRGVVLRDGTSGSVVQRNVIGLNAAGDAKVQNTEGMNVGGAENLIGGPGVGNVISGNLFGVVLNGPGAHDNVIQANYIGTAANGTTVLGNYYFGVEIYGASDNLIGGTVLGEGNIIAGNDWVGIFAWFGTGNAFLRNSIFDNKELGIDLVPQELQPNDPLDADFGPNHGQNYPVLASAVSNGSQTAVHGTLASAPNTQYRIELFGNPSCDSSGFGEGKHFLGAADVVTDAAGIGVIDVSLPLVVLPFVTATATSPDNDTSEFSPCTAIGPASVGVLNIAENPTLAWESDAKAHIVVTRSQGSTGTVTVQYEVSDGTATTPDDYADVSGVLTFQDGEVVKTFDVPVVLDMNDEPTQEFHVTLSAPTGGAALGPQASANVMLFDYDPAYPTVWISDAVVVEGNAGNKMAEFTVTLSPATSPRTVGLKTVDGTAVAGQDYVQTTANLLFNPGDGPKVVQVPVIGDFVQEQDEVFFLMVNSLQNATVSDGVGDGGIIDDDASGSFLPMIVTGAKLRKDKNADPSVNNGSLRARGSFVTDPGAGDVFDAGQPISVTFADGVALDHTITWDPAACTTKKGTTKCKSVDKLEQATFKPVKGVPDAFRLAVTAKKTAFAGPFAGPVTVTLAYGSGTVRKGAIATCKLTNAGLTCS